MSTQSTNIKIDREEIETTLSTRRF